MSPTAFGDAQEPPSWSPSPIRRLLRLRRVYWTIALVLAATAAVTVHRQTADARDLVRRLGTTVEVIRTEVELAPGDPIATAVVPVAVPAGLVPDDAVTEVPDGAVAGRRVAGGALLTTLDLTDAIAPRADEATIAVGSSAATPPVAPGDAVVLVLAADPFAGVAAQNVDARVVTHVDDRVVVAVNRHDLADVAAALQLGGLTVAKG